MTRYINAFSLSFIFAILFTFFFFEKTWGLNLFLFHSFLIVALTLLNKPKSKLQWLLLAGSTISVVTAFVYHSVWSLTISWISVFMYSIALFSSDIKSIHYLIPSVFLNWFSSIKSYGAQLKSYLSRKGVPTKRIGKLMIYIVPLGVLLLFVILYSFANPAFAEISEKAANFINKALNYLWQYVDIKLIFFFLFGLVLCVTFFYKNIINYFIDKDQKETGFMKRVRKREHFQKLGLKQELKAGIFLLSSLNLAIAALLFFEIRDVWIGFTWDGEFLKGFVHEGISILIVSIIISILVALYFFRGNQNFYSKSLPLKYLTYAWVGLNAILAISVFIRNFYYIQHFVLAYKRIGVVFFLVAVMIGLITVIQKIMQKRNLTHLLQVNTMVAYGILVLMCLFNWDVLIAQYNLERANKSFVHLNFLIDVEDRALPYLDASPVELRKMELKYRNKLRLGSSSYDDHHMDVTTFEEKLEKRKELFLNKWKDKDWLEWNPAEAKAAEMLTDQLAHKASRAKETSLALSSVQSPTAE